MSASSEKRQNPRNIKAEIASLMVMAPPEDFTHQGEVIYASSVDLSRQGLQLHTSIQLPFEARVDIWITLQDAMGSYHLRGQVVWIRENLDDSKQTLFSTGIKLLEESDTHYPAWVSLFEKVD